MFAQEPEANHHHSSTVFGTERQDTRSREIIDLNTPFDIAVHAFTAAALAFTAAIPSAFSCDGADPEPLVVAHRGSLHAHPENTLAAFAWAEQIGADLIELDVRFSADGYPVVIHDATVDRTTNGRGAVAQLTLRDLSALDAGRGEPIPTLEAALAFAHTAQVNLLLDIKDPSPHINQVTERIASFARLPRVIVGVHSITALRALGQENVQVTRLAFAPTRQLVDTFLGEGVDIVRVWPRWLKNDPGLVTRVHQAGACTWATTKGLRGKRLENILDLGVSGLITDHPPHALALIEKRRPAAP